MSESRWRVDVLLQGSWRGATSVLLSSGGHHIVVDTGLPHEAHQLVKALEEKSLRPCDIGTVINTHFHVDHVLNNSLFPSSVIYGTQQSYDWSRSLYSDLARDDEWEKLSLKYYPETLEYENAKENMAWIRKFAIRWWDIKRLGNNSQYRWIENRALPEGLEARLTSGHVPGHLSILVPGSDPPTLIAADALVTRDHDERVLTMIPVNRKQFERDRAGILAFRGRIIPGHDRDFRSAGDKSPGGYSG